MKTIFGTLITAALFSCGLCLAQNDSFRQQKKQKKDKRHAADTAQQHWLGDHKNWPADTIQRSIHKTDSLNKVR